MEPEQLAASVRMMKNMPQEQQESMAQMMGIPPQMLALVRALACFLGLRFNPCSAVLNCTSTPAVLS
jgi:hypothetical protein